jgi:CRISPR/Cas system-associated endonuclease Cas1
LQSLALINGTALKISKELISGKLNGQASIVRDMLRDSATADAIDRFQAELPMAESIESVRLIELQSARLYWQTWSELPINWLRKDEGRVPEHWKSFSSRISPLTHSPRLAANPANALLNLLYSLLESESTLAISAMGLLPEIGLLHADTPRRNSLSCDIMEVCRPQCDAFVLNWLQCEPLLRSDFWEDRNGNCRIASRLAIKLCETSNTWRKLVAPVAEYVAQALSSSMPQSAFSTKSIQRILATRLTQRNKRRVKGSDVPPVKIPEPERVCRGCGKGLQGDSVHCKKRDLQIATHRLVEVARAGRVAGHTPKALAKEAATHRKHAEARRRWKASNQPAWLTEEVFSQTIQPAIAKTSATAIANRIGVSRWYAGRIREGYRPHPRHWEALAQTCGRFGKRVTRQQL